MHGTGLQSAIKRKRVFSPRLHNGSYATFVLAAVRPIRGVFATLFALLLLIPAPGAAQDPPVWGYLDNGLAYLLIESHAAPLVGSSIIVHTGSAREGFATSGASHFLEHLLFNGTETRSQEQLYDDVEAIGAYNNATTRRSHVAYMILTPAEKIREGLEIQADMLFHSTLPDEKVEKERGIILEEIAKDRDQGSYLLDRALRLATFGPDGPGLPIVGTEQAIRTLSRDAILGFYRDLYTPQNMTLVVVGAFEAKEMEQTIREVFGVELPGTPPPPYRYTEPVWDGREIVTSHEGNTIVMEWTSPGPDPARRDFIPYECLVELLSGTEAAPLNQTLKERYPGKILSSGGSIEIIPGRSYLHYRVEADRSIDYRELSETVLELLRTPPVSPSVDAVEAWKVSRETEEYFLREKPHYYAILRGERIAVQGIEGIVDFQARLRTVTPATVSQARFGIDDNAYRLAVAVPQTSSVPGDSIPAETTEIKRATLSNGAEILILSSPESPVLAFHLFLKGRSAAEPIGMDGAVELMQRLMASRTSASDPATLERKIRAIGAELKMADNPYIPYDDYYSTHEFSYIRLQSLDRYAEEAFSLLAELLGPPAWTDREFEEEQRAMLSLAERRATGARATAGHIVRRALYGGTLRERSVFGEPAHVRAMVADSLRALAARYLVGHRLLLVVATGLPAEQIIALAETRLGFLPSGSGAPESPPSCDLVAKIAAALPETDPVSEDLPTLSLPDSSLLRRSEIGARQGRIVWVQPLGRIEQARWPALQVWNANLSNEIQFQLREKEGLAYSIGSSVERLDDGTVVLTAVAGANARSLPRILEGFREQLQIASAAPPDSATIRRQGIQLYGRSLMRRATRMNRAYAAGLALLDGRDPGMIDAEVRAPTTVTSAEIEEILPALRTRRPNLVAIVR